MVNKTVLITGATGTIGKATAIELAKNNCKLILLGRNPEKLSATKVEIEKITGNKEIDFAVADLSEPESVKKVVEEIKQKYSSLSALINVAAIFKKNHLENSQGNELMFATNHLGPFYLSNALIDLLKAGAPSKVITVTAPSVSKINFEDVSGKKKFSAGFMGAFGASKMMNLMFTYALAGRMEGTGISAMAYHPGLVKSDLTIEMPAILNFIFKQIASKPDKAAKTLCNFAIDDKFQNTNGKFFRYDGKEIKSNKYSYDKDLQEKLWMVSEGLNN